MGKVLAVTAGAAIAAMAVCALQLANHQLFLPPGTAVADAGVIAAAPLASQVMLAGTWFVGALAGGLIAARISGGSQAGWIVTLLVAAAGAAATALLVPHLLWLVAAAGLAPLVAGSVVHGAWN